MIKTKRAYKMRMSICLIFFAVIIVFSAFFFHTRMTPIIKTLALSKANNVTTVTINNTINNILKTGEFNYNDLVDIEYDLDGKISAVKTDSIAMNIFKTQLSVKISEAISSIEESSINIALGTLTGSSFMTGHGPKVTIRTSMSCSCSIEVKNSFEYSGINQTLHKILLNVTTNVYVIAVGETMVTQVLTSVPVAQTIIIGQIPEIYAGANDTLWQDLIG